MVKSSNWSPLRTFLLNKNDQTRKWLVNCCFRRQVVLNEREGRLDPQTADWGVNPIVRAGGLAGKNRTGNHPTTANHPMTPYALSRSRGNRIILSSSLIAVDLPFKCAAWTERRENYCGAARSWGNPESWKEAPPFIINTSFIGLQISNIVSLYSCVICIPMIYRIV